MCAVPLVEGGFALMWSGIKASFGVSKGKVAYQVKVSTHHYLTEWWL